jgi:hypothetical protein
MQPEFQRVRHADQIGVYDSEIWLFRFSAWVCHGVERVWPCDAGVGDDDVDGFGGGVGDGRFEHGELIFPDAGVAFDEFHGAGNVVVSGELGGCNRMWTGWTYEPSSVSIVRALSSLMSPNVTYALRLQLAVCLQCVESHPHAREESCTMGKEMLTQH